MKELIERLEKATGPNSDLDEAIACFLAPPHPKHGKPIGILYPKAYTKSLDAALTLVPQHHLWQIKQGIECCAIVWMIEVDYDDRAAPIGYTTTFPALALCIAALKARAEYSPPVRGEK
jgi:hypothetical protein